MRGEESKSVKRGRRAENGRQLRRKRKPVSMCVGICIQTLFAENSEILIKSETKDESVLLWNASYDATGLRNNFGRIKSGGKITELKIK